VGPEGSALFRYRCLLSDLNEPRLIVETGLPAHVEAIALPVARDLNLRIVRVKISNQNGKTVQIMAERADGTMSVDECALLSRALSPALDVDDPIGTEYHLEISSPGIDRPLVRESDFIRAIGHEVRIEMEKPALGRKRFRGTIVRVEDQNALIELVDVKPDQDKIVTLPIKDIAEARLILTDALIRETLKRGGPQNLNNDTLADPSPDEGSSF
jgi:ribosome maturation factor RimP